MGGLSPGESDELRRRAIGAWRSTAASAHRRALQAAEAKRAPEAFCDKLFKEIQGFAKNGFLIHL